MIACFMRNSISTYGTVLIIRITKLQTGVRTAVGPWQTNITVVMGAVTICEV